MHSNVLSATTIGVDAHLVHVEADVSFGLVNFYIVGLPDTAIKESSKRIQTALKNCGFRLPAKKITINLAPADLKKVGTLFDLPISIAILQATEYISLTTEMLNDTLFLGEVSLEGTIRPIKGALAIASLAKKLGKKRIILPLANAKEAALIEQIEIIGVSHITELIEYLRSERSIHPTPPTHILPQRSMELDFSQVKGQLQAKRALQIAAAGRHNILFIGSPGSGKTMLAKRLLSIMPPLSFDEVLETTKIHSIAGKLKDEALITQRPFSNPHHTISQAGLIGGGSNPQPGQISLAHKGILFLDELTEFKRDTLEALRQPLENKEVHVSRIHNSACFPADFLLIAALNPCPCGFLGDKKRHCSCSRQQISKYIGKLSGPLIDRIDLQITIQSLEYDHLKDESMPTHSSADLIKSVDRAIDIQKKRFGKSDIFNNTIAPERIESLCVLTESAEQMIKQAFEKLNLSMRGYHKILKVARTIADLSGSEDIDAPHIREAIMYRSLDQFLEKQKN